MRQARTDAALAQQRAIATNIFIHITSALERSNLLKQVSVRSSQPQAKGYSSMYVDVKDTLDKDWSVHVLLKRRYDRK